MENGIKHGEEIKKFEEIKNTINDSSELNNIITAIDGKIQELKQKQDSNDNIKKLEKIKELLENLEKQIDELKQEDLEKIATEIGIDSKKDDLKKVIEESILKELFNVLLGKEDQEPIKKALRKLSRYILVIDEINRAPLASVLGELIYGLEYRGSAISTPYERESSNTIKVPDNLYIIGTMNTADRSIGSIDYAVRRRFAFVPVLPDESKIEASWGKDSEVGKMARLIFEGLFQESKGKNINITYDAKTEKKMIEYVFGKLQDDSIDVNDIKIGHTYFLGKTDLKDEKSKWEYLKYRLEYQVKPIIEEYYKDGILGNDAVTKIEKAIKIVEKKPNNFEVVEESV